MTKPTRYAVETLFTYGWENCWTDDNGKPLTFARYEAEEARKNHIIDWNFSKISVRKRDLENPREEFTLPVLYTRNRHPRKGAHGALCG